MNIQIWTFFAIVDKGWKQYFIENLSWLSSIHPVAWCFLNTADGYKLLFEDGVFCEFAVFELTELERTAYSEGRFIWRDESVSELLAVPKRQAENVQSEEFLLGELLTNLYVGLCRDKRGEHCSAMRFIQVYAVDRLIMLFDLHSKRSGSSVDKFCPDRRVEHRHPDIKSLFPTLMQGVQHNVSSARAMFELVKGRFCVPKPLESEITDLLDS